MWMWSAMTNTQRSRRRALGRRILRARLGSWVSAGSDPQAPLSTGPRASRERSGTRFCRQTLRRVWYDARKGSWSAPKSSPSNPDSSDPNEEAPKTGALQSAPGFLGPVELI
ncbi:hypothetical protein RHS04_06662 [Rhizoctonia solani]|uniref:Uncharacterized protein n=1 Tax=Rhizoctonia solani TaxID=456999 RepID=A0A8H7H565_9AGAM|nr:hypothetical protein RHS04_06662 [Rhizoctonia solani]